MAASWKGSIAFGLVEIPAELQRAEETEATSATMLDSRDMSPVGYKRYNKKTGKEVEWGDIVSGYEYEKGNYVVLTDEEREQAHPKTTKTIEIQETVDATEIEPLYYERPYYVRPLTGSGKAYAALRDALASLGKAAIAQVVMHTRQHLAAIVPRDDALMLYLLRYPHEIREAPEIEAGKGKQKVSPTEAKMAEELVKSLAGEWKPEKYRDTYRDELMKLVETKASEGRIYAVEEGGPTAGGATRVLDLMEALKKSVQATTDRPTRGSARSGATARSHSKATRKAKPVQRKRRAAG